MQKYRNKKTDIDGITFDSTLEARRYKELKLLLKAGKIKHLQIHPRFQLLKDFFYLLKKIKGIWYEADFCYDDGETNRTIVEDCKGMQTKEYLLKKKLWMWQYPHLIFRELKNEEVG